MFGVPLRTFLALALAGGAALSALTACTSDTHDPAQAAPSPPLATAGPKTRDLFLTGTVRRGDERVRGAQVYVELASTEDVKDGHVVPTWDTKCVTTDADGRYSVRLDPDEIPGKFFEAVDTLNFDLDVIVGKHFASWGSTLYLVGRPQVWRSEEARVGDTVMDMSLDFSSRRVTTTDSDGHKTREHFLLM
jgi:hypothetical protein